MRFTTIFATIFLALRVVSGERSDADRTFQEICIKNGFEFEEHSVTTNDGYILTVYRIPGLQSEASTGEKPPLFMQHGLFDSAYCWIVNYADVAPAFVAARAGYDVWLGNSRGNTYSRAHVSLDPDRDEKEFFDFSWYEMGLYDIPAVFDHIRSKTNNQKIAYIGHSQGTTQMFAGLAEMENSYFLDKTSIFVAIGPVSKIPSTKAELLQFIVLWYDLVANTTWFLRIFEIFSANWITSTTSDLLCTKIPEFCELLLSWFTSSDPSLDDDDRYAVYMGHQPNGASMKALLHYAQNMREDRFQVWANKYNNVFSRDEKITKLIPIDTISQVPIAMFIGTSDILATSTDSEWTKNEIGDAVIHYEYINAGHLSYFVGKDMSYFNTVMDLLAEYQPLPSKKNVTGFLNE